MIRRTYLFLFVVFCFFVGGGSYFLLCRKRPEKNHPKQNTWSEVTPPPPPVTPTPIVAPVKKVKEDLGEKCRKAFALQQQNLFQEAEAVFTQAIQEAPQGSTMHEELLGGDILTAFLAKDTERLQDKVVTFEGLFPNSFFLDLFRALLHYRHEEYADSLRCLSIWKNRVFQGNTFLLKKQLDELNVSCFIDFLEVEEQFALHDFSAGRLVLYRILDDFFNERKAWNTQLYNKILLMLGHSFLKESQLSDNALFHLECFKNILFYLEKTLSVHADEYEKYLPQRELLSKFKEHIIAFDAQGIYSIIGLINFIESHYVAVDTSWITHTLLESFSSSYDSLFRFCSIFGFLGSEGVKQDIVKAFEGLLSDNIRQANIPDVQSCLYILQQFDSTVCLNDKFLLKEEDVKELIVHGDDQLSQLKQYLYLLQALHPQKLESMQAWLLSSGEYLWCIGGQDDKALQLFALMLQDEVIGGEELARAFIKKIYLSSLSNHQITRLLRLEDFIAALNLPPVHVDDELLASFLEDAKFLCSQGGEEQRALYHELFSKTSSRLSHQPKVRKFLSWLAR